MATEKLVIVGGSAAGARAAQAALADGFSGWINVLSQDARAPYYRPALSKQLLRGTWSPEKAMQAVPAGENLVWHSGVGAVGLDTVARTIALSDGRTLGFDRLILASGSRPRRPAGLPGSDLLPAIDTLSDVKTVTSRLVDQGHVVVIGGGLIGSEVASTLTARGVHVTIVDPAAAPLARALGPLGNDVCMDQHRAQGVDLRLGSAVCGVAATPAGVVAELDPGGTVVADAAVLCIGVVPHTEWLAGSGVSVLPDGGLDCDANLIVRDTDFIAAAGDVACWESARAGRKVRVEHWLTAVEQGAAAARNVLRPVERRSAFDGLPMFWTEQHGKLIHVVGFHGPDSKWRVVEGTSGDDGFVTAATADEHITGYLLVNAPRLLGRYRQQMLEEPVLPATA